jgi:hypothetical protein
MKDPAEIATKLDEYFLKATELDEYFLKAVDAGPRVAAILEEKGNFALCIPIFVHMFTF